MLIFSEVLFKFMINNLELVLYRWELEFKQEKIKIVIILYQRVDFIRLLQILMHLFHHVVFNLK